MPLRRRQRILGVLTVVHDEPNKFNENDLPLLNAIAGQAAIALENGPTIQKKPKQERRKLSAIIASTQDAVLMVAPTNEVLLLNPAAQEMLKLGKRPWPGRQLAETNR